METRPSKKQKKDYSLINLDDDYNNIDLIQYKQYLYQVQSEYESKIQDIKNKLKKTNTMIAKKCEEKNGDHEWIREREDCMYGDSYIVCRNCRTDKIDRSYLHY